MRKKPFRYLRIGLVAYKRCLGLAPRVVDIIRCKLQPTTPL